MGLRCLEKSLQAAHWLGHEDSIRYLPKFSRKITEAGRHLTYGTGPTMACSHESQLVLKAPWQHNNLRIDAEQNTKDDVVIVSGNVDGDETPRVAGHTKGGFHNPTGDPPTESSSA